MFVCINERIVGNDGFKLGKRLIGGLVVGLDINGLRMIRISWRTLCKTVRRIQLAKNKEAVPPALPPEAMQFVVSMFGTKLPPATFFISSFNRA